MRTQTKREAETEAARLNREQPLDGFTWAAVKTARGWDVEPKEN